MPTATSYEIADLTDPPDPTRRVTVSAPTSLTPEEGAAMVEALTTIVDRLTEEGGEGLANWAHHPG